MIAAGFCVNTHGGPYEHGKARPIQDKAAVDQKYFELEENLLAGQRISVLSLLRRVLSVGGLLTKLLGILKAVS